MAVPDCSGLMCNPGSEATRSPHKQQGGRTVMENIGCSWSYHDWPKSCSRRMPSKYFATVSKQLLRCIKKWVAILGRTFVKLL